MGQQKTKHTSMLLCSFLIFSGCFFVSSSSANTEDASGKTPPIVHDKIFLKKDPFSLKHKAGKKPSILKKLHVKAQSGQLYQEKTFLSSDKKLSKTALDHNQFQIGTNLSDKTSLYVTASFKEDKYPRGWDNHHPSKKSFIMPGVGFEWQPPEKIKVLKYQWRMPEKLSLSGELRADILHKDDTVNSIKNLPSRLRFNAVLFKVHYTLGKKKK